MNTRAALVNFHKYTPFGSEYYQPIFDFFIKNYREIWGKEVDKLYILDSNWNVDKSDDYEIIRTDPNMRYYDCYKAVLPQIKEDLVLFLDDDMVIYKEGVVDKAFNSLLGHWQDKYDVVTIMDQIGTWHSEELTLGNKFCPYFFATRKDLLMKYLDVDWSPDSIPDFETLGKLTKAMVEDGATVYEMEDDKSSIYFDGTKDGEKGKDLGYYHIRAGSTPTYLLATKKYGDINTYNDYIKNQPTREILRQLAWYQYMLDKIYTSVSNPPKANYADLLIDLEINPFRFLEHFDEFKKYHNLP